VLPVVEALPPDQVKERLIVALAQQPQYEEQKQPPAEPTKEPKSSVDELLSELTKAPASKEWEIDLYEVQFLKRIGQGAAGTTYLAKWSGLEVAVKVASISEMGLDGWRKEVQSLQKLHHPNIIRLLGSVYHPNPLTFCLVLEYCNAGDLVQALKRPAPVNFFFRVAGSISKGMTYLHHRGIIHRDIKPGNVLLDGKVSTGIFSCKLADFGVATDSKNMDEDKTAETGTYRWMSPEVIRHEKYTQTADVFSYGVLLWQLLTREVPFAAVGQIEAAAAVALEDRRCPMPAGTPEGIQDLIEQCWASVADKRPAFESVTAQLKELENNLTSEEHEWLAAPIGHRVYEELPGNEVKNKPVKVLDARKIEMEEKKKMLKEGKKQRAGFKRMFLKRRSFHF
jgi:mitogen-activated protein kinase kinase kinase 11